MPRRARRLALQIAMRPMWLHARLQRSLDNPKLVQFNTGSMYREDLSGVKISNMFIRTRQTLPATIFISLATLLLLAIVGCSSEEPTPTPVATPVSATEAVELARKSMADLQSFSFQLTHDSGHTTLSGALELTRAVGLVATNGLDLEAEANIGRAFVRVEAVVIGEQTWMTNPLTGVWSEIAPEDSPFSFLDPVKLVADILGDTQNSAYPDSHATDELQILGTIPAQSLAALVGTVDPEANPEVVLFISPNNNLLQKIVINGIVQPEDEAGTIRVITLSEFDKQVSLEPPI
ncbi:LppX_LprAFG lipoprotein [Candidatus Lucifugimonas marina]|uniref:LppX_LprAFG lipoprotein n=1 Tax=Candidatus Lucifugimonas marina TaxID=3038979 RepID=A0AAJ5ZHQ4_9CHLR|nr:LppX_LprAFG lipoprotein [SAR202 cluster bacterium JH702]MDG0868488.1 LppX_LprAFG lipoprotein [SAR202 cluster bacterium JH639]WFG35121.1 LppX_LprAFG lipoprotein [SAR202 cluster bacterium JH545]WFG39077.1 LppX_LprAFG lipoprotein [SAR202 cluster bacterium JH1073]